MPLDPSILFKSKAPKFINPLKMAGQAMSLKSMARQGQAQELKLKKAQRAEKDETQFRAIMQRNVSQDESGQPQLNRKGMLSELYNVNPGRALKMRQEFKQQDIAQEKAAQANEMAQMKNAMQENEMIGSVFSGVKDQQSLDVALVRAERAGLDTTDVNAQYDPNNIDQINQMSMSYKDQLAQGWKQKGYEQKERAMAIKAKAASMKGAEFKAAQTKNAGFGRRLEAAEKIFAGLVKKGYKRESISSGLESGLPGLVQSAEGRQQEQAERNFLNAVLRLESGAMISDSEFDSGAKQYFPRVGDDPQTLINKEENRKIALAGMKAGAGRAWDALQVQMTEIKQVAETDEGTTKVPGLDSAQACPAILSGFINFGALLLNKILGSNGILSPEIHSIHHIILCKGIQSAL